MNKKLALIALILAGVMAVSWKYIFLQKKAAFSTPQSEGQIQPRLNRGQLLVSKTVKEYTDPSGFSFNYSDNLSLTNNEIKSERTYADIKLSMKELEGDISIVISDSSFNKLEDWALANSVESSTVTEAKLGNLKASEMLNTDRLILGALDQGVLFTVEVKFGDSKDFWMEAYNKILEEFTFAASTANAETTTAISSEEVIFEGEEVVN